MSDEKSSESAIRIMAVGDIMLGICSPHSIVEKNNIPMKLKKESASLISKDITKAFNKADLVFGNLECVISKDFNDYNPKSWIEKPRLMMAPPEAINVLTSNNIHLLNIANNHMLDHGRSKVKETQRFIKNNNLEYIGDPENKKNLVRKKKINNKEICFLGYNLYKKDKENLRKKIEEDIITEKNNCDVLIVSLHWGQGHVKCPSPDQVKFGRKLIDLGAKIVLGHHSHVFHPVELYNDGILAYSLGNFIFDMWRDEHLHSGILDFTITQSTDIDLNIIPTKQIDHKVMLDSEKKTAEKIYQNIDKKISNIDYEKMVKNTKKKHYNELFHYYISNFYKFPLKYHFYILSKWGPRILQKVLSSR